VVTAVSNSCERQVLIRLMDAIRQNYIPDICTEQPLWIREYPRLNLVVNRSEGNTPEGDASPRPERTSEGTPAQLTLFVRCTSLIVRKEYFPSQPRPLKRPRLEHQHCKNASVRSAASDRGCRRVHGHHQRELDSVSHSTPT
jgi:hypothetical protein